MVARPHILACFATTVLLAGAFQLAHATPVVPAISNVRFVNQQTGLTAKIFGTHFGKSPVKLPCNSCTITELQFFYFVGDDESAQAVNIKRWNDSYIELTGLTGSAGTTAIFAIKNDSLGKGGKTVAGTANLPGGTKGPKIRRLTLLRDHKHLKVVVDGRGFGSAPTGIPGNIDTDYFQLWIWVTNGDVHNYPWSAGHGGNTVTLNYESWTDSRIVVSGFGSEYRDGGEDWVARPGDAVAVTLFNSPGGGAFGPSTGKAGRISWPPPG
jgi:hypothetical protein